MLRRAQEISEMRHALVEALIVEEDPDGALPLGLIYVEFGAVEHLLAAAIEAHITGQQTEASRKFERVGETALRTTVLARN